LLTVLKKDDAPLRMAVGFALGSCTNFFPTMGFGLPVALVMAFVSRTSLLAAVVGETVFKPFFPLFYCLDVYTGHIFYRIPIPLRNVDFIRGIGTDVKLLAGYAKVFLIGSIINTLVLGTILTGVCYVLVSKFRYKLMLLLKKREEDNIEPGRFRTEDHG